LVHSRHGSRVTPAKSNGCGRTCSTLFNLPGAPNPLCQVN
jgi:hypothetical protein